MMPRVVQACVLSKLASAHGQSPVRRRIALQHDTHEGQGNGGNRNQAADNGPQSGIRFSACLSSVLFAAFIHDLIPAPEIVLHHRAGRYFIPAPMMAMER